MIRLFISVVLLSCLVSPVLRAGEITVAAASNFTAALDAIVADFEAGSGHTVHVSYGSSGRLYAQVVNGAPFDVFFSADQEKPAALEADGRVVAGSRFTYAVGVLVLWARDPAVPVADGAVLDAAGRGRIALANPRLAPYGRAAMEVIAALDVTERVEGRLVRGENVSQAYQFVDTGNAVAGFVALAQVMRDGEIGRGSAWIVPENLYAPIRQDAVLLQRGAGNPAASEFLDFVRGNRGQAIIRAFGYQDR